MHLRVRLSTLLIRIIKAKEFGSLCDYYSLSLKPEDGNTTSQASAATSTPAPTSSLGTTNTVYPNLSQDMAEKDGVVWRRAKVVCDYDATNRNEMSLMMNEVRPASSGQSDTEELNW